jgi:HK97 family phage major capsid protein
VDAYGRYIWQPQQGAALATGMPRTIGGFPVYNSEFVPDDGTNANKVLIFGDFSAYIIAQRASFSTVVLRERFADTDQTGIILFERVGGGLWNTDALRVGIV